MKVTRLVVAIAVGALVVATAWYFGFARASPDARAPESNSVTSTRLHNDIVSFLANRAGRYRVAIRELTGERRLATVESTEQTDPASIIKLFYAWLALREVDAGRIHLSDRLVDGITWNQCLRVMIEISDNQCSIDIREHFGNAWVNAQLRAAGFTNTDLVLDRHGRYQTKRTTAADVTRLLGKLEAGTLLSPASTTYFHQLLLRQVWRSRIASGVPAGVVVESKLGNLAVQGGIIQADSAIVRGPTSTYVLTIIGDGRARPGVIRDLSALIFRHLQGVAPFEPATYPAAQYDTTREAVLRSSPGGPIIARIPAETSVEVITSFRLATFARVRPFGKGWIEFRTLRLAPAYRWPAVTS